MDQVNEYLLKEASYILVNGSNAFECRKSSNGCDVIVYVNGRQITCGKFTIPPHKRLGRISAHPSDETYYVIKGTLRVLLPRLEETIEVKEGEVFYMPGGMIHAPLNESDEECVVLWHCAPTWP